MSYPNQPRPGSALEALEKPRPGGTRDDKTSQYRDLKMKMKDEKLERKVQEKHQKHIAKIKSMPLHKIQMEIQKLQMDKAKAESDWQLEQRKHADSCLEIEEEIKLCTQIKQEQEQFQQQRAPSGGGLPSGWTEYRDPKGTPYYHNGTTGKTSWTRPSGGPAPPPPSAPAPGRYEY